MGPSGSGKSTLMHCLAGLDTLTSGQVFIGDDRPRPAARTRQLTQLRRDRIGFVFQAFNLVPDADRPGEHHAPDGPRRPQARPGVARRGRSHTVGLARPPRPPPVGAVRRPAAAGRRGPGPGQPAARSSSPTSRPATSTPAPAPRSSRFMRRAVASSARPSSWSPTTPSPPATPTASCSSPTAASSTRCTSPTAEKVLDRMKAFGD